VEWKHKTKEAWDKTKGYRQHCRDLSTKTLSSIEKYLKNNYNVVGILGVEFDPTSAVHQIENGTKNSPGKGIFMEELEEQMRKKSFQVPIIGVNLNNIFSSIEKIHSLVKYS
jgi:predicted secreted protein